MSIGRSRNTSVPPFLSLMKNVIRNSREGCAEFAFPKGSHELRSVDAPNRRANDQPLLVTRSFRWTDERVNIFGERDANRWGRMPWKRDEGARQTAGTNKAKYKGVARGAEVRNERKEIKRMKKRNAETAAGIAVFSHPLNPENSISSPGILTRPIFAVFRRPAESRISLRLPSEPRRFRASSLSSACVRKTERGIGRMNNAPISRSQLKPDDGKKLHPFALRADFEKDEAISGAGWE